MLTIEMAPYMIGKTITIRTASGSVVTDVLEEFAVRSDIDRYGDGKIARIELSIEARLTKWHGRFDGTESLEVHP